MREACRRVPASALGYGDPRGSELLREVLAAYLRRVRGAAAEPEQITVSTGFAQGLNLVFRALAGDGVRTIAVEDPGNRDQGMIAQRAGLEAVAVPVDAKGIHVQALAATGVVLAPERRQALVS